MEIMNLEGFGKKSMDHLIASAEASKGNSLEKLLFGLGIKGIGAKMADTLAKNFGTLDNLLSASYIQLTSIKDVGDTIAQSLGEWQRSEKNMQLVADLKALGVNMSYLHNTDTITSPFTDKTIVVTGTLVSMSRKEIKAYLTEHGANVTGSVSKKTDLVIVGADPGSKYDKAVSLGITIMNEDEFREVAGL